MTLAKSILTSIPVYTMQSTLLPKGICDKIDKMVSLDGKQRVHLLNLEIVTSNKDNGGLGIRSMRRMNLALMTKLG